MLRTMRAAYAGSQSCRSLVAPLLLGLMLAASAFATDPNYTVEITARNSVWTTNNATDIWGINETIRYEALCSPCDAPAHNCLFDSTDPLDEVSTTSDATDRAEGSVSSPAGGNGSIVLSADCEGGGFYHGDDTENFAVVDVSDFTTADTDVYVQGTHWYIAKNATSSLAVTAVLAPSDWQGVGSLKTGFMHWWKNGVAVNPESNQLTYMLNRDTPGEYVIRAKAGPSGAEDRIVTIVVVGVDIKLGENVITDTTTAAIVGSKISLEGVVQPSGLSISSRQWTVPGTRIKGYTATTSSSTKTDLAAGDLDDSTVNFYWVDGGNGRAVKYSVVIGGGTIEGSATFDVSKPTATMSASTGTVAADSDYLCLALHFGNPYSTPGISFSRTVTVPEGFSGTTQYWQMVTSTLRRRQENGGAWYRLSGTNLLDTTLPYSADASTNDSPGQALTSSYQEVSASDQFTMWIMFKPSGTDTIWIPLRSINWSWSGDTTRTDTTWTLVDSSKSASASAETTTLPIWSANVTSLTWTAE